MSTSGRGSDRARRKRTGFWRAGSLGPEVGRNCPRQAIRHASLGALQLYFLGFTRKPGLGKKVGPTTSSPDVPARVSVPFKLSRGSPVPAVAAVTPLMAPPPGASRPAVPQRIIHLELPASACQPDKHS